MQKFKSDVSGKEFPDTEKIAAKLVRQPIIDAIRKDNPDFDGSCHLALSELIITGKSISQIFLKRNWANFLIWRQRL